MSDIGYLAYRIPMSTRFRGIDVREGLLLEREGKLAEFSPFPEYPLEVAARWARAALEALEDPPRPVRDSIPVNGTVPAVDPQRAAEIALASGCSTVKVKVGEDGDEERVAAVRDALGPDARIRVDVNGAWDVPTAVRMINRLERYALEYVEQPTRTVEELAEVRRKIDIPIAADESIRNAEDPMRVRDLDAADIVVLKVQPLGGARRALDVADRCGLSAVVSSALETSVGIAAGLALAAALPSLPFACGLGTVALLEHDVVDTPLIPQGGMLPRSPELSLADVERWHAPDIERRWIERFEAAAALA